jgi:periplasmic divalent cation tolerance protein
MVVTVNTDTLKSAKRIAAALLKNRTAVSVNFIKNIESVYYWKGKINKAKEVMLLVKTSKNKYKEAEKIIKLNHPYQTPEILCFNARASKETLLWLNKELK